MACFDAKTTELADLSLASPLAVVVGSPAQGAEPCSSPLRSVAVGSEPGEDSQMSGLAMASHTGSSHTGSSHTEELPFSKLCVAALNTEQDKS